MGRPINSAIYQNTSNTPKGLKTRKEWTRNTPQELITESCRRCPLLPSKPGQDKVSQALIAAADSANRLKRLVDGKLAALVFSDPDDLSARRVAAYMGLLNAEARSDKNRFKKQKESPKVDYID